MLSLRYISSTPGELSEEVGGRDCLPGRSHHSHRVFPSAKHRHRPSEGGTEEQRGRHRRRKLVPVNHNHCQANEGGLMFVWARGPAVHSAAKWSG